MMICIKIVEIYVCLCWDLIISVKCLFVYYEEYKCILIQLCLLGLSLSYN